MKGGPGEFSKSEREDLDLWIALHLTRSYRSVEDMTRAGVDYDLGRTPTLNDCFSIVSPFSEVWIGKFDDTDEPLILSDHPIIQLKRDALLFPFSPRMIVALCDRNPEDATFEGRSWCEAMNEMSFIHAEKFFVCNPKYVPDVNALRHRSQRNTIIEVTERQVRIYAQSHRESPRASLGDS